MSHVVKSVGSILTGKSKTSTSTEKTTSSGNSSSSNWIANNPLYQNQVNSVLNESQGYKYTPEQMAAMTPEANEALQALTKGVDTSGYKSASDYLQSLGKQNMNQGQQTVNSATSTLSGLSNMSQEDYQKQFNNEYNSDLVNSQLSQLKSDLSDKEASQVQNLNQAAGAAGGMGNSRAGVAEGVIHGEASRALASGEVQYRTAEEQAAASRLSSYLNLKGTSANSLASIGSNQVAQGNTAFGQGMTYLNQYNSALTQNAQNALTAQELIRQYQQQQLEMSRRNQQAAQSPALQRLMMVNQGLAPIAQWSTVGNTSGTQTTTSSAPTSSGGIASMLGGVAGMYLGSKTGSTPEGTDQNTQLGGMFGSMFGNAFSR